MKLITKTIIVITVFCLIIAGGILEASETTSLKALIVTGRMGPWHNWQVSSPILKQYLEETGLFKVDVAKPAPGKDGVKNFHPSFADYNVVVIDYDDVDDPDWPEETKKAFADYVSSGGGVVIYHSSNNSFPKWKEYNEIIGIAGWGKRDANAGPWVYWKDGETVFDNSPGLAGSHGPAHEFEVINRVSDHPVTKGLPEKWIHAKDELYGKLRGPAKNLTILATAYSDPKGQGTDVDEPVLFTVNYGKGRVFHTTMGHVHFKKPFSPAIECVGFMTTFQRGTEWAATGNVTQKVPDDFPTETEVRTRKVLPTE